MNRKSVFPFYIAVIAIIFVIISPHLFSHGMFVDGLLYARISKNLANGLGSFWHLQYSSFYSDVLEGQPPLAIGIQSLFFRVFGNSYLVERGYSLLTFVITGILMYRIWRIMTGSKAYTTGWMPIFMWGIIPLVFWSIANNVLENTMMVFVSLSVFLILKSYQIHRMAYLTLAGLCISSAFLCKGFTGIFPLSFVFWLWLFRRSTSFFTCLKSTAWLIFIAVLPYILMYLFYDEATQALKTYLDIQVFHSIDNVKTVDTRFYIIGRLFSELLPILLISAILYFVMRKHTIKHERSGWGLSLLALGLSGVLPIMVSLKQSGFYMLCAFPFFCLSFAYFIAPELHFLMHKIRHSSKGFKIFSYVSVSLFLISIGSLVFHSHTIGREKTIIEDVFTLSEKIDPGAEVSIDPALSQEWSLRDYFGRYYDIVLHTRIPYSDYFLVDKQSQFIVPEGYQKDTLQLHHYDFYVRSESEHH